MASPLDAALSGMIEQQRNLEYIANNLANVNTTAYKKINVHFQDLLDTAQLLAAQSGTLPEGETATTQVGVQSTPVTRTFAQGSLTPTGRALDLAVSGDGFFRVKLDDGSFAYTRDGAFNIGVDGRLVTTGGFVVDPPIELPPAWQELRVSNSGEVSVRRPLTEDEIAALQPGEPRDGKRIVVGQISLVRFPYASGLASSGQNLFVETPESQAPVEALPGIDGMGDVYSGWLEGSNVDIAEEMVNLTFANRAYQLNATAYRTIEEMLRQAGQIA